MGLSTAFNSTIVEQASGVLILALRSNDQLDSPKQREKTQNISARNRVLRALIKASASADPKIAAVIKDKIEKIQTFFESIGGQDENKVEELGTFALIQKAIENPIPSSILLSLKPNEECSPQEIKQKLSGKDLRDQILKRSMELVQDDPIAQQRLNTLLSLFECPT